MVKIKICGLTCSEDIKIVNELLPDYIGFVFTKSKRQVTFAQAQELKKLLRPEIKSVGVFVNSPIEKVVSLVDAGVIDLVQLHGNEDTSYCEALRQKIQVPIIKVIRIRDESSMKNLSAYASDYFLFDTFVENQMGGSGKLARINLLTGKNFSRPYFLAGGLTPENVSDVLKKVAPFAVDVSSGVETDGIKDKEKITAFIKTVRQFAKVMGDVNEEDS